MKKSFLLFLVIFLRSFFLFASDKSRILSPSAGTWANKQCLFVDLKDGEECYYSLSGSDPLESGFVYDGPVLLDAAGKVFVKVTVLKIGGGISEKEEYDISYSVDEFYGSEKAVSDFVRESASRGVVSVNTAKSLDIPAELKYSFWDAKPVLDGKSLRVRRENNLSRYVPCTVSDGNHNWRFLVYVSSIELNPDFKETSGYEAVEGLKAATVIVYGTNGGNEPLTFAPDNVPEGGELSIRLLTAGIRGESVRRTLYKGFSIDALDGEEICGTACFEVFRDDEPFGVASIPFSIDRKKPEKPGFALAPGCEGARGKAEIVVSSEESSRRFFSVKGPFFGAPFGNESAGFLRDGSETFRPVSWNEKIVLLPVRNKTTWYKIFAYTMDSAGNKSDISEHDVVIDPFTYYFVEKSSEKDGDGSRRSPFTKTAQVFEAAKKSPGARFFVDGTLRLSEGKNAMPFQCSFSGTTDSKIIIPGNGFVSMNGAKIALDGFVIERESGAAEKMFVMEKSSLSIENCEIVGNFDFNAVAFQIIDSDLELSDSGLTVQGTSYSCPVMSERSEIKISSSRVSAIGNTAVCFSAEGGSFSMDSSLCRSIAHFGRIAELVSSKTVLKENAYQCDFDIKMRNSSLIWTGENETDSFFGATLFR